MNKEDFIAKIIVPIYTPFITQNILLGVKDDASKYIIITDKAARFLGFKDHLDAQNKSTLDLVEHSGRFRQELVFHDGLVEILNKPIEVIDRIGAHGSEQLIYSIKFPIYYPDKSFFGVKFVIRQFEVIFAIDFINVIQEKFAISTFILTNCSHIKLGEIEELILFYLILGKSHLEIANLLQVTRNFVTKTIDEKIGVKFGLSGGATQLLVDKAINCGFHRFIPKKIFMSMCLFNPFG